MLVHSYLQGKCRKFSYTHLMDLVPKLMDVSVLYFPTLNTHKRIFSYTRRPKYSCRKFSYTHGGEAKVQDTHGV